MMRKLIVMAMVAGLVGIGGYVKTASAGATIDLVFVSHNGVAITPTNEVTGIAPGDTLKMDLIMSTTTLLGLHAFSLQYDIPGGDLTPGHKGNWTGVAMNKQNVRYTPLAVPFSPTTPTFVGSWQSTNGGSTNAFLQLSPAGGYTVGTVVWKNNTTGQSDILSGLFNAGVDGFVDNAGNLMDPALLLFHGATVNTNVVPEPGTAALLGFGLVGLVLAGRRRNGA